VSGATQNRTEDLSIISAAAPQRTAWARVLEYEPPTRLVFSWDVSPAWQIEVGPNRTSEVEVRFSSLGPNTTRVDLEHRNIERHGQVWEEFRDAVGSETGWPVGLGRFRDRLAA
jgi:uncharacterized protein YndB with AHSA1/START domain